MTPEQLIQFEQRVADAFAAKQIRAPIHLSSPSQAEPLIRIFREFRPGVDWLFSNWRSHFHCLLAGVPEQELFDAILGGRSMYYCSKKYKVLCSAIVGGILPIACGVALGLKRSGAQCNRGSDGTHSEEPCPICDGKSPRVWVVVGDMCATTGIFHEFKQFCRGHSLPVKIVVEENGFSTNTPVAASWGTEAGIIPVESYKYERTYPHAGIGSYVAF